MAQGRRRYQDLGDLRHGGAQVDALAAQTLDDFEAVIVDNASTDGSLEALVLPDARFQIRAASGNLGFAAANNLAAADRRTSWIATLNPDAVASKTWLEELARATLRYPTVKVFGSTQIDARKPDRVDGFGDLYSIYGTAWRGASGSPVAALRSATVRCSPCVAGALYARDAYLSAGGFYENV